MAQCKAGEYVVSGGTRWLIESVNATENTVTVRRTLEEPVILQPKIGG